MTSTTSVRGPWTPSTRLELDVGGRGRPGDERHGRRAARPSGADRGRLGDELDDLAPRDDADVEVGDERERAAALARARGEDERAGLGDRDRAAGEHAVERVELARRQAVVLDDLDAAGRQSSGKPAGTTIRDAAVRSRLGDRGARSPARDAAHLGAVVADALAEELDARAPVERRRAR